MEDRKVSNIPDTYTETMSRAQRELISEILNPHASIIRRLRTMRNSLSLEDPTPVADVALLDRVIQILEAHS